MFRAEGGEPVGMGHLVRCRALASALKERGIETCFVTTSRGAEKWLASREERVECIEVVPGSPEDAEAIARLVHERPADWLVTDGQFFSENYLGAVAETGVLIASIDDLATGFFPTAIVVNGGLGARTLRYHALPTTRVLVGPEYALLRREFRQARPSIVSVQRVLVCFGGADPEDWTSLVKDAWSGVEKAPALALLVGPAYPHLHRLQTAITEPGVSIYHDLDGRALVELMSTCDLAIASAGMVACELAALGVPLILSVCSDDQRINATALAAAGAAYLIEPFSSSTLREALRELAASPERCRAMAEAGRRIVDGLGTERMAEAMLGP